MKVFKFFSIVILFASPLFTSNSLFADRDINFVDITDIAGVGDISLSPSCAMADFDNNGLLDIYLCIKNQPNKLYWNSDGIHFLEVARRAHVDDASTSMDCAFADINNDGWLDLFVSNEFDSSRLFLNTGNGTYIDITPSSGIYTQGYSHSPTFADIEKDGDLDLFLTNAEDSNLLFINNSNNTFTDSTVWSGTQGLGKSFGCFFGDINGDLIPDLYIVSRGYRRNILYMGLGNGQFVDTTFWSGTQCDNSEGQSSVLFDYDNDGDLDIYVANGGLDSDSLFSNDGNGHFTNVSQYAQVSDTFYGRTASCGDFNNDGFQDLIVLNSSGNITVYQNNGDRTFSDVTSSAGLTYQEDPAGCSIGDIDNDGDLDLYIANITGKNILYQNQCNDQNYLKVKLVGSVSNRFGIGSKIRLYNQTDSIIGYREMKIGKARLSMNPPIVHFGLQYGSLYKLTVIFPSGIQVDSSNIEAAQTITIYENPPGIATKQKEKTKNTTLHCIHNSLTPPYVFRLALKPNQRFDNASIYDLQGRQIKILTVVNHNDSEITLSWNGRTNDGISTHKGIYFLKVKCTDSIGETIFTRKITLIE